MRIRRIRDETGLALQDFTHRIENGCLMSKMTRREFAAKAAGTLVATAALPLASTGASAQPPANDQDAALKSIDSKLAHPLSAEARKLTQASLNNSQQAAKDRFKFKLADCSEPCFQFIPTEAAE